MNIGKKKTSSLDSPEKCVDTSGEWRWPPELGKSAITLLTYSTAKVTAKDSNKPQCSAMSAHSGWFESRPISFSLYFSCLLIHLLFVSVILSSLSGLHFPFPSFFPFNLLVWNDILPGVAEDIGGWAQCNGCKESNGTESNTWKPCLLCVWYTSICSIPVITRTPSSYISTRQPPLNLTWSKQKEARLQPRRRT